MGPVCRPACGGESQQGKGGYGKARWAMQAAWGWVNAVEEKLTHPSPGVPMLELN